MTYFSNYKPPKTLQVILDIISNQVKILQHDNHYLTLLSCHMFPTTWSVLLKPYGSSRLVFATPDMSPLLLKDLRVTTSSESHRALYSTTSWNLERNIFPLSTASHRRESTTLKLILFHYLTQAKRILSTNLHRRKSHP